MNVTSKPHPKHFYLEAITKFLYNIFPGLINLNNNQVQKIRCPKIDITD